VRYRSEGLGDGRGNGEERDGIVGERGGMGEVRMGGAVGEVWNRSKKEGNW